MANAFIRKLGLRVQLDEDDRAALERATMDTVQVEAGRDLVSEGERAAAAYVILDGFACRYKIVPDGGRSIVAYLVPGDGCDLHASILNRSIHAVATLTPCTVATVSYRAIGHLVVTRPNIYRALWWSVLVDEAIIQEWLVGVGRRPADRQVAHVLCEVLARLQAVGLAGRPGYRLPLTQSELADTAGLSSVHLYRVLADLRKAGLIESGRKSISVPDLDRLKAFAAFDPDYLYLDGQRPATEPVAAAPDTST